MYFSELFKANRFNKHYQFTHVVRKKTVLARYVLFTQSWFLNDIPSLKQVHSVQHNKETRVGILRTVSNIWLHAVYVNVASFSREIGTVRMQARLHYRQCWSCICMRLFSRILLSAKYLKKGSLSTNEISSKANLMKCLSCIYINDNVVFPVFYVVDVWYGLKLLILEKKRDGNSKTWL